jgi:hypothetical protein
VGVLLNELAQKKKAADAEVKNEKVEEV